MQPPPPDACPICNGGGWVYRNVPVGHSEFGKIFPCECKETEIARKRLHRLEARDGLNEEQRAFSLDNADGLQQIQAAAGLREMVDAGTGQASILGGYGLGKSYMMIAAVNYAKSIEVAAHYTTLRDLLAYLRQAFGPEATDSLDQRWTLLTTVPVLAIDEMDKANSTPWALEQFRALVDKRWANLRNCLTLYGMNAEIDALARSGLGDVADRLEDRNARIFRFSGNSLRRGKYA